MRLPVFSFPFLMCRSPISLPVPCPHHLDHARFHPFLRSSDSSSPEKYKNIACARVDDMKHLPDWFEKGQVRLLRLFSTSVLSFAHVLF